MKTTRNDTRRKNTRGRSALHPIARVLDERAQMAHDLLIALAKRCLADANKKCGKDWPAGQQWEDLGQSSRDTFKRRAREEAGIDHDAYVGPIRRGEIHVEEHD